MQGDHAPLSLLANGLQLHVGAVLQDTGQPITEDAMARRGERDTSEKPHRDGDHDRDHDRDHDGDHRRPHPAEDGSEHRVHLDIFRARWVGSAPPTADTYAKALAQWRALPGVIATSATDLGVGEANPSDAGPGRGDAP
jgi:hypothetical protein